MKKNFKKILLGIIACAIILSTTAIAASNSKMIEAFYTGIKLYIDGGEITPKDAKGNIVEPFIYNGTTYLPVRAVAEALGKDVVWDGANQSVYIGKEGQNKPDNYLDKLQYVDYRENYNDSEFTVLKNVTDCNDKTYKGGLLFKIKSGWDCGYCEVDYALNSQYNTLKGTIVLPKSYTSPSGTAKSLDTYETTVIIYNADTEEELFRTDGVFYNMPYKFDIKVKGVNKITIRIYPEKANHYINYVALTDLALYK